MVELGDRLQNGGVVTLLLRTALHQVATLLGRRAVVVDGLFVDVTVSTAEKRVRRRMTRLRLDRWALTSQMSHEGRLPKGAQLGVASLLPSLELALGCEKNEKKAYQREGAIQENLLKERA